MRPRSETDLLSDLPLDLPCDLPFRFHLPSIYSSTSQSALSREKHRDLTDSCRTSVRHCPDHEKRSERAITTKEQGPSHSPGGHRVPRLSLRRCRPPRRPWLQSGACRYRPPSCETSTLVLQRSSTSRRARPTVRGSAPASRTLQPSDPRVRSAGVGCGPHWRASAEVLGRDSLDGVDRLVALSSAVAMRRWTEGTTSSGQARAWKVDGVTLAPRARSEPDTAQRA